MISVTETTVDEMKRQVANARERKSKNGEKSQEIPRISDDSAKLTSRPNPKTKKPRNSDSASTLSTSTAAESPKTPKPKGRRPLPEGQQRESITLRFRPDERKLIESAAGRDSVTISTWMRMTVLTAAREAVGEDIDRLIKHLGQFHSLFRSRSALAAIGQEDPEPQQDGNGFVSEIDPVQSRELTRKKKAASTAIVSHEVDIISAIAGKRTKRKYKSRKNSQPQVQSQGNPENEPDNGMDKKQHIQDAQGAGSEPQELEFSTIGDYSIATPIAASVDTSGHGDDQGSVDSSTLF